MKQAMMVLVLGLMVVACKPPEGSEASKPQVVATTTMIADLARELGGDRVHVMGIMKPGGDPHLYQPVPSDSQSVARANLVLKNGLKLEGWLEELLENAGGARNVVAVSEGVSTLDDPVYAGNPDPHIWHDVKRWRRAAENVRDALIEMDPEGKGYYTERATAYLAELDALDAWVREQVAKIPEDKRHVVTSHDAFQYFGQSYGFQVRAIQGISTESEASAADLRETIEYVKTHQLPAVFIETSVKPALMEKVKLEAKTSIGGTLYSDSLGPADSRAGTYIGMIRANVTTVVEALAPGTQVAALPR